MSLSSQLTVYSLQFTDRPGGPLILLGGMGLQPEFAPVWKEILAPPSGSAARMIILPLAPAEHKPAVEQRARLADEYFSGLSMATQILWGHESPTLSDAATLLEESRCVYVMAGEGIMPLWPTLWQWHRKGIVVIAAAGTAITLGEHAFAPMKPYPPVLETLEFEPRPGAGILPNTAILPYFARFPGGLQDKLVRLFPPEAILIGIDEQAALVSGVDGWRVAGLGSVTILSHNQAALVAAAGTDIATYHLPPYGADDT